MNPIKALWRLALYGVITFLVVSNFWIIYSTSDRIFTTIEDVPKRQTALVFGTSKYKTGGGDNLFFQNRMKATADLYTNNKVDRIILSGTKDPKYYDEPRDMTEALKALGVPEEVISVDNLGFRTLDTIENSKSLTGDFVLVTQKYHAYRALFISDFHGIDAVCYEASFPSEDYSYKTVIREVFARPKAILDLYFLD